MRWTRSPLAPPSRLSPITALLQRAAGIPAEGLEIREAEKELLTVPMLGREQREGGVDLAVLWVPRGTAQVYRVAIEALRERPREV